MRTFEKILCPVDFSEGSVKSLQWAEAMARKYEAEIVVLHVMALYPAPPELGINYEQYQSQVTSALRDFAAPLRVKYERMLSTGDPANKIAALASGLDTGLIVMSTRGMVGAAHKLLGSVTEQVVRTSVVPVMTISPNCEAPPETFTSEILLPLASLHRTPKGYVRLRRISRELTARVNFLHVVDYQDPMFDSSFSASPFLVTTYASAEKTEELARLGTMIIKNGNRGDSMVQFGDVAKEIVKELDTHKYDFVLLGAKQKNFLSRFIETTTYKVISQSPVPVITVKVD
jgi:nucleotide-binding universal stress UspA family protein